MKPIGEIRSYKWINDTLSSNFIKDEILASTDSFAAFFIHKSSTCSLKSSLYQILFPKCFHCMYSSFLGNISVTKKKVKFIWIHFNYFQKQLPRGVLKKRYSENMLQIYRRAPMPKCDFNKVAKHFFYFLFFHYRRLCSRIQGFKVF